MSAEDSKVEVDVVTNQASANDEVVSSLESVDTVVLSVGQYRFIAYFLPLILISGLIGNVLYTKKILADELISRPPVAVIPVRESVLKRVKGSNDPKALSKALAEVNKAGKSLKDNGYLVLDADYVYAYPGDVEALP